MLNDDIADRTLPPTERRRNDARAQGQVARSPQITAALILLAASLVFRTLALSSTTRLAGSLRSALMTSGEQLSFAGATDRIQSAGLQLLQILGPLLGAILICGLLANMIQTGWLWVPGRLTPHFRTGKLLAGERVWEAISLVTRSTGLIGWTLYFSYQHRWELSGLGAGESIRLLHLPLQSLGDLGLQLSLILLTFAAIDYGYRFWRHEQSLKMSVEERRRELQDESIAPEIRRRQRTLRGAVSPTQAVEQVSALHS